jgi:hypothetical protein
LLLGEEFELGNCILNLTAVVADWALDMVRSVREAVSYYCRLDLKVLRAYLILLIVLYIDTV